MSAMPVELSDRQRELLLRGLRFVRSSRMLEFRETSDSTEAERGSEIREINELSSLLQGTAPRETVRV